MNKNEWAYLIGSWPVLPDWLALHRGQIEALANGDLKQRADESMNARTFNPEDIIVRGETGIAHIPIHGPMIKRAGFFAMLFGFISTDMIRLAVDHAASNEDISAIMLHIESPGGHVAGIHELAESVKKADMQKPVAAHIEDIGASAAYWVASQARRITASPIAEVGSLGTMTVIADMSAMAEREGIKIHVISTGKFKGMGVPGTPIEDEHLGEIQRRVNDVNTFFMRAVRTGRGMDQEALNKVNDGRVWIASRAKELNLIDEVRHFDAALKDLGRSSGKSRQEDVRSRISQQRTFFNDGQYGLEEAVAS